MASHEEEAKRRRLAKNIGVEVLAAVGRKRLSQSTLEAPGIPNSVKATGLCLNTPVKLLDLRNAEDLHCANR